MILVTGGTGLVGSHLLHQLTKENKAVRAIYRSEKKQAITKKVFSYYSENPNELFDKIEWLQADLLETPSLNEAFKDISHVYHCAAYVSFEPNKYHLLRKTNIEGTANIVNFCIANHIKKLCYVSSIATIGKALKNKEITEETHWNPEGDNNIYGITKYGAEMEVWRGTQEGLDAVIVNPGVILGAGIWKHGSGHIFKKVAKGLSYYTNGKTGYVDVFDVVKIMMLLMESNLKNERYILVSENWSYKSILESIAKKLEVKTPTKEASRFILNLGWKLDWLNHKLTGKRRKLSKQLAQTLVDESSYCNSKIKTDLTYNFKPVAQSISEISKIYLEEN